MATTAATKTTCPTCGAEIPRPDLSLCPYCASPLQLGRAAPRERSETVERLLRMEQHAEYAAALALEPPEESERTDARSRIRRGGVVLGIGALLAVIVPFGPVLWPLWIGLGVLALLGAWMVVRGLLALRRLGSLPILKRPALVTDRRSETALGWWHGATIYYFSLELADGTAGEFRQPGRGTREDPLVVGRTGIAYTRGRELLAFKAIKV